ncbi:preprotein translocase subunit SecE [Propioniciclava sinopodophylli]|uniref:preprotein translocase subunit SecE n=1 Tax=Propioniciclava sinopodophylli TaxID=1837344 RepID=UPI0024939A2C|nr:preprotein translocase subunit SecE [Propioniciclava sinopodophylli]
MAPNEDSNESLASPDDRDDLPGELLGEDLVEPEPYLLSADETEAEELDATAPVTPTEGDAVAVDDPAQLAAAETVAQRARSSRPVRRTAEVGAAMAKGTATRARKRGGAQAVAARPTGPVQFVGESVEELKKVVWPTWSQVQQYFWAVLVFVLIVIAYVGLLDLGFGWLLLKLFG